MIYEDILMEFERKGVRYLVVGGVAVNLYGYVRLTMDVDIMVDLSDENLLRVVEIMGNLGYSPRVPINAKEFISVRNREQWIKEKGAVVFTFIDLKNPYRHVDIFLNNPVDFEEAFLRKEIIEVRGIKIFVASIDDLIKMKLYTQRPRDKEDIIHLEKIKKMREK